MIFKTVIWIQNLYDDTIFFTISLVKTSITYDKRCIIKLVLMVDQIESDVPPICLAICILILRNPFFFFFKNKDCKY